MRFPLTALATGVLLSFALVGCNDDDAPAAVATPTPAPTADFTLQLLHVSDADGSDTTALNSVANLSALVSKFRAEMPSNTIVLSSGDNYIPGPRFNASDNQAALRSILGREGVARADIALLNAIGIQASAVGNHELDLGTATFADAFRANGAWPGAAFPYLGYNIDFTKDSATNAAVTANGADYTAMAGKVSGWTTITVGGEKIGVIGASSATFPSITSSGALTFAPGLTNGAENIDGLAAEIQKGVDEIKAAGINKVVLIAHMQKIATEEALATKLRDVDIIVAGGSNTRLVDANDTLRAGDTSQGTYPKQFNTADGKPVVVVNVDADYKYLGRFIAPFDKDGVLIPTLFDNIQSGAFVTSETNDAAGTTAPIPRVVEIRDAVKGVIAAKDGAVFGRTETFIEGRRQFVRTEETNAGNLSADANLWYAQQIDPNVQISLKNGGGIRAEIGSIIVPPGGDAGDATLQPPVANPAANRLAGEISLLMIETSYKFNNRLWAFDVTAQKLLDLLNHGVADVENIGGRFPQVSGVSFSFDPAQPAGQRVRTVKVGTELVVQNGAVVGDAARPFRLVTLNFLATGGDGYPFGATDNTGAGLVNLVKLEDPAQNAATVAGGRFDLTAGGEQDAFAEYLGQFFPKGGTGYNIAETPKSADLRIQNLSARADTLAAQ